MFDRFTINIRLSNSASKQIYITPISLVYSSPKTDDAATINVYVSTKISYIGKETSSTHRERFITARVLQYNQKRETWSAEILLQHLVPLDVREQHSLYVSALKDIITFDKDEYSTRNNDRVELHSSLTVSGLFGDWIDGLGGKTSPNE